MVLLLLIRLVIWLYGWPSIFWELLNSLLLIIFNWEGVIFLCLRWCSMYMMGCIYGLKFLIWTVRDGYAVMLPCLFCHEKFLVVIVDWLMYWSLGVKFRTLVDDIVFLYCLHHLLQIGFAWSILFVIIEDYCMFFFVVTHLLIAAVLKGRCYTNINVIISKKLLLYYESVKTNVVHVSEKQC